MQLRDISTWFPAKKGVEVKRPDVKAASETYSNNRLSEVASPSTGLARHTGGSRLAIDHGWVLPRSYITSLPSLSCYAGCTTRLMASLSTTSPNRSLILVRHGQLLHLNLMRVVPILHWLTCRSCSLRSSAGR
eukprot:XP_015574909.1 uncharacterized protein LOC107261269 [Ricinus communis]